MEDNLKKTNLARMASFQLWHWRAEIFHVLLISIVGLFICRLLYLWAFHPLASIPGPAWAHLTRLWSVKNGLSGHGSQRLLKLHQQYGKPRSNCLVPLR